MNNLKKNHRLAVVLLSFLSGMAIFPPLLLAGNVYSVYTGYVTYYVGTYFLGIIRIDISPLYKISSITGKSPEEVSNAISSILLELNKNLEENKKILIDSVIIKPVYDLINLKGSLSQYLTASRTNPVHLISSAAEPELNSKRFDEAVNSVETNTEELGRVIEPLFSPEGLQLDQINNINSSVKRTKESLFVLLEELNSIPDNQPKEVLIAKKEMLNSINDLTFILSDVSEITKAYNKAISESE